MESVRLRDLQDLWRSREHWVHEYETRKRLLKVLGFKTTDDYLRSAHWIELAALVRVRDRNQCQVCQTRPVHVHHLTYTRLGGELLDDLVALCASCHAKVHTKSAPTTRVTVLPPMTLSEARKVQKRAETKNSQRKRKKKQFVQKKEKPISSRTRYGTCTKCQQVAAVREGLCRTCR